MTVTRAVAAWTGPAALVVLAAHVFDGHPDAPLFTLLVAAAPCVALLRRRDTRPSGLAHAALALPGLAALVAANAAVLGEFARLEGLPRLVAPMLVAALTLLPLAAVQPAAWNAALGTGVVAALAPLFTVGIATGTPPWMAWQHVASRAALVFSERSAWVTDGRVLATSTALAFDESHRVTAMSESVWRVTERDAQRAITRDRRVAAGDTIVFRPGDRLVVPAGSRLRFEAGRRVPGVVGSGAAWADPMERRGVSGALASVGLALALAGAAVALVPPVRVSVSSAPVAALPCLVALGAALTGVYAMYVAPDIALGAAPSGVLHDLPRAVLPGGTGAPAVALAGVAVLALHVASTASLFGRLETVLTTAPGSAATLSRGVWLAMAAVAVVAAASGISASWWLALGVGLLASVWTAPSLPGAPPGAATVGAAVGAVVFAGAVVIGTVRGIDVLRDQAVVFAAPAAWAVAALAGRAEDAAVRK